MAATSVKDIMTTDFVSVGPETSIVDAAKLIIEAQLYGVPVLDAEKKLVGILTEYDLISKESFVHLPTLQMLLGKLAADERARPEFQEAFSKISNLVVKDVMNAEPLTLPDTASFDDVVQTFRLHHRVNPIPVVDAENRVVGVVTRTDLLKPLEDGLAGK